MRSVAIPAGVDRVVRRYEPVLLAVVVALGIVALVPPLRLDPLALGGITPFADGGARGPAARPAVQVIAPVVEASPAPAPAPAAITAPDATTAPVASTAAPSPSAAPRTLLRPGGAGIAVAGSEVVVTRAGRIVRGGREVALPAGADPVGVAVRRDGSAVVADGASGRLFDVDGDRVRVLATVPDVRPCLPVPAAASCDGSLLDQPPSLAGVVLDGDGRIYVADSGQRAIWRIEGNRIEQWLVDPGMSPAASADGPSGLAIDGAGNLLASAPASGTLVLIGVDDQGRPGARRTLTTFDEGARPAGLSLAPDGRAFVALAGAGVIAVVAPTGEITERVAIPADLDVGAPVGTAVRGGELLVVGDGAVVALTDEARP